MPLEPNPQNFNALNTAWPTNTDGATVGNEHIQQLKSVLQAVFPDNGAPGQFAAHLILAAAGTSGAPNAGQFDIYARDLDIARTLSVTGRIERNAQVAIAQARVDGTDGSLIGTQEGVVSVSPQGNGDYEVQLVETGWEYNDLTVVGWVNYALLGAGFIVTYPVSTSVVCIRCLNGDDGRTAADAVEFTFALFDRGRD